MLLSELLWELLVLPFHSRTRCQRPGPCGAAVVASGSEALLVHRALLIVRGWSCRRYRLSPHAPFGVVLPNRKPTVGSAMDDAGQANDRGRPEGLRGNDPGQAIDKVRPTKTQSTLGTMPQARPEFQIRQFAGGVPCPSGHPVGRNRKVTVEHTE